MTPDSPNDPHDPDPLDERLSAELDGAADPETGPSDPSPAAVARARDLAAARDLLAIAPPPVDELTRRRLLTTAIDDWQRSTRSRPRDRRRLQRVGAAAAVLALIAVGGAVLANHGNHSGPSRYAGAAGTTVASPTTHGSGAAPIRSLREVSNPDVLRRRVEALLHAHALALPNTAGATTTGSFTASTGADAVASGARCVSTVRVPAGATPELLGTATFHGAAAVIVIAHDGPRILVFVLAKADCRPLTSQFISK
jgi:hypothetical protein